MQSMLHLDTYSPVIYQKIRVSTQLYGVNCKLYYPVDMDEGFQEYSNIVYAQNGIAHKLLIPKAVIHRSMNAFSNLQYSEDPLTMWSTDKIPKYSKLIIEEISKMEVFLISQVISTTDPRNSSNCYYSYELISSSSIRTESVAELEASIIVTGSTIDTAVFKESIDGVNIVSTAVPSTVIKFNSL